METNVSPLKKLFGYPYNLYMAVAVLSVATIYFTLKPVKHTGHAKLNPAFGAYISAYTSGTISRDATIRIQFTSNFLDSSKIHKLKDLFSFEPSIKGEARWIDGNTIEFKPAKRLPSGEKYEVEFELGKLVTVPSDLQLFSFHFETMKQSFELNDVKLQSMDYNNISVQRLTGTLLTADVESDKDIEKIVSGTQEGKALQIFWEHAADHHTHHFFIDSIMRKEKQSEIILAWNGNEIGVDLKGENKVVVPALGDFKVMDINIKDGDEQYISILFSDPLLLNQDLNGMITLNGISDLKFIIEKNEVRVYPGTRILGIHNLVVNAGIKNTLSYVMPQAASQQLEFADLKPAVTMVGKGVIMPNSDKLILPFTAVSLKAVDVTVIKIFENNVAQFLQVNELDGRQELKRVARPIIKKTIRLDKGKLVDLRKPNQFALDLGKIIKAEPGAIYNVMFSFKKSYSLYRCNGSKNNIESAEDDDMEKTIEEWDKNTNSYWEDYDEEYDGDYNWNERDDPCSKSYYQYSRWQNRNVLASDLGLIAKKGTNGELFLSVSNLRTTRSMPGVSLEILDFQQQLITKAVTDNNGWATLTLKRKPFLLVAKSGAQRGYLKLDEGSSLSLSRFDVSGEVIQKGLKGFLYGERGVWRPGDSLYLTFILEDKQKIIPADHPVSFELFNPLGQLYKRIIRNKSVNGFYDFSTCTEPDALTGSWVAKVKVGGATFQRNIRIETVMPNRLKINLNFAKPYIAKDEGINGTLEAKWLHGATAPNLNATVEVSFSKAKTEFKKFYGYIFDDPSRRFTGENSEIFNGALDENGRAKIEKDLNSGEDAPGMLNANFVTKVFEPGGNFSIDRFSIPYHPYDTYIGMLLPKSKGDHDMILTDTNNAISIVAVNPDGTLSKKDKSVEVTLYKVQWRWWWDRSEEDLSSYSDNQYRQAVQHQVIQLKNGVGKWNMRINYPEWGRYFLKIKDTEDGGHSTGKSIYIDWPGWYARDQRQIPGEATMLSITSDKEKYKIGEDVIVNIPSGKEGRALVSVESGTHVVKTYWVDVKTGQTQFRFTADRSMMPNVFVHVTLLQPHAQTNNDLPIRMYGMTGITVEDDNTILKPKITMPASMRPEESTNITVSEASGKPMTYTLAIVDEGLLDLTRFKTPDPHSAFYAHEALGVQTWDLFDFVIGAFSVQMERILSIGGDQGINKKSGANKANRFKPVVKFIGPFYLPAGKTRTHAITLPQYFGAVRVMVVAGNEGAYGYTDQSVPVKKPLMILGTLPRVLGPGESVKFPVTVFAMEKKVRNVSVEVVANNFFTVTGGNTKSIIFNAVGEQMVTFDMKMKPMLGVGRVKVIARCGNESSSYDVELDVRNPNPFLTDVVEGTVEGGAKWNANYKPVGMVGTNTATLEISAIPPINLDKRLNYLIHYPYGCIEQTTSSVFPQLTLGDMLDLSPQRKAEIENNIKAGIQRIKQFQTSEGGLSYWPGENYASEWGTNYGGHFMIEAQNLGYALPFNFISEWKRYQRNKAVSWSMAYYHNDLEQAYRLYTLALAKSPELGAMNRMKEIKNISNEAKWRLAAAYVLAGQKEVALQLINGLPTNVKPYRELGYTFGSNDRDEAMILEVLNMLDMRPQATLIVQRLAKSLSSNDWMSTQTTAYSLLAISKFCGRTGMDKGIRVTYSLNGGASNDYNTKSLVAQVPVKVNGTTPGRVEVINKGKQILYARIILNGQPEVGDQISSSNNLLIDVKYKTKDGKEIDPTRIEQGTDFVAEYNVTNPGIMGNYEQMALSTVFPSGWEIHNSRMDGTNNYQSSPSRYVNIRDDRVYTFFNIDANKRHTYYVLLNASYLGRFYLPSIACEAMYNGNINARKAGMWVEVVPRSKAKNIAAK